MKKIVFSLVSLVILLTSTYVLAAPNCVLPIDNTSWDVAALDNNGAIGSYHPTPWVFKNDGQMSAEGYWKGTWYRNACDKIHASITHNSGKEDVFEVIFATSQRFIATKNGNLYRFGKKK